MDPVQALAILSLGAFVTVLVTAFFYIFTVRPRLLDPTLPDALDHYQGELAEQRTAIDQLNTALVHHTAQLSASTTRMPPGEGANALQDMLRAQSGAVETIMGLLNEQSGRLAALDEKLAHVESHLSAPVPVVDVGPLSTSIQAQADRLIAISARLDEWAAVLERHDAHLAEHARMLADLDRRLAEQAQTAQQLDTRVSEHTTLLITAAAERREQAGILERIGGQIGQLFPLINQIVAGPPRLDQDRLTDIKGIGPVYASKLYEAGIFTFRQLAAMTPEELDTLIGAPKWRAIDAGGWVQQAEHFASQREKVESLL